MTVVYKVNSMGTTPYLSQMMVLLSIKPRQGAIANLLAEKVVIPEV